jgi:hypothetical protein
MAGAPKNNSNAEKWTREDTVSFLEKALNLSKDETYDFLGEIAKELNSYIDVFDYLIDKFPDLKHYKTHIMRNCEANCFSNSKKGNINTAIGIVNLKSNHGWTDRVANDHTSGGEKVNIPIIEWVKTGQKQDEGE